MKDIFINMIKEILNIKAESFNSILHKVGVNENPRSETSALLSIRVRVSLFLACSNVLIFINSIQYSLFATIRA